MIDPDHPELPIVRQCELVSISRSGFYYQPAGETPLNLELMRLIDRQFLETPWYGSRQMARHLRREGYTVGRKRVRRLMARMGLEPIYQRPRTTVPHPEHQIYPYLLREMVIERPNQVWCADITYLPMQRGFLYLVAVMDWASRKVLSWRVSNTMDADFCIEALEEALERFGKPEIFNTDQGSQGGFKWSSQHPLKGSCDAKSKAAVGTGAAVLTWSPTGDRTRREPAVLGGDCGRYGE